MKTTTLQNPIKTLEGNIIPAGSEITYRKETGPTGILGYARVKGVSGEAAFDLNELSFNLKLPTTDTGTLVKVPEDWTITVFYAEHGNLWSEIYGDFLDAILSQYKKQSEALSYDLSKGKSYETSSLPPPSAQIVIPKDSVIEILGTDLSKVSLLQNLIFKVVSTTEGAQITEGSTVYAPFELSNIQMVRPETTATTFAGEKVRVLEADQEVEVSIRNNIQLWENLFIGRSSFLAADDTENSKEELAAYYASKANSVMDQNVSPYDVRRKLVIPAGSVIKDIGKSIDPQTFDIITSLMIVSCPGPLSGQTINGVFEGQA